jgi:hypothetical protein
MMKNIVVAATPRETPTPCITGKVNNDELNMFFMYIYAPVMLSERNIIQPIKTKKNVNIT